MRESQLALIAEGRSWTFAALRAEARRVAQRLAAFGVRPGDRVGMLLPNAPHAVFLIHAVQQLGAVLVPLNLRLTSAELLAQAQRVRLRCLVHNTATAPQASALAEIAPLLDIDAETPSAPFCAQKRTLEALHTLTVSYTHLT
ncbi:MAG: long-chain fatty acid--CoA ligase, partial [Thermoflexales bacterium]|nr:long-chain fatty acid--CoA ligase [Thermoflexales bacterium]